MSKLPQPSSGRQDPKAPAGRYWALLALVVVVLAGLLAWAAGLGAKPGAPGRATAPDAATNSAGPTDSRPAYARLVGKWMRPDGGYIIDIRNADNLGKLDAAYFNPNPINVSRAEASGQGAMIKVSIELRDVNYPGSTYTLAYDTAADQLKGVYFQAATQQHYEVYFERMK